MPPNDGPTSINIEELKKEFDKAYDDYLDTFKKVLVKEGAKAFIEGDMKAQKALDLKLSFNLVNKEALKYIKEYKKELEAGGCTIQGGFIPWLEDKSKEERAAISKILEEGYKAGKPTGVKERIKGGGYPKNSIAAELNEYFNTRKSHAAMVARTEIARIQSHGSLNRYNKQGVKKVQWLVFNPCPICSPYARRVYLITELPREVPAHPNCRCALAPVPDDIPAGGATTTTPPPAVFERGAKAMPPAKAPAVWKVERKNYNNIILPSQDEAADIKNKWRTYYEKYNKAGLEEDLKAIKYYVGSGYEDFNTWLRSPITYMKEQAGYGYKEENTLNFIDTIFKPFQKRLDVIIDENHIESDSILFRCCGRTFADELVARGEAIENGYMSTATHFSSADIFGNSMSVVDGKEYKNVLILEGKAGDKGLYINTGENEILKPRDTKLKLIGVAHTDGMTYTTGRQAGKNRNYRFLFCREVPA